MLGKPKRPRSAFNIFMSEHFQEAKGISIQVNQGRLFILTATRLKILSFVLRMKIITDLMAISHYYHNLLKVQLEFYGILSASWVFIAVSLTKISTQ